MTLFGEIERLEEQVAELKQQLKMDRMTGIFNRSAMKEHIANSRYEGWYVFADIDGLGAINKDKGHEKANAIIKEFGRWLRKNTRQAREEVPCDAIAIRQHGDEFLVWCSNRKGALAIRERIRNWYSLINPDTTCSAGMGREADIADRNMAAAKRERKKAHV